MKKGHDQIILSEKYADGFVGAALTEGVATLLEESNVAARVKERLVRSRYKSKSLELFVLFPKVHLRHVHEFVNLGHLEAEGVVTRKSRGAARAIGFLSDGLSENDIEFLEKVYLLKSLISQKASEDFKNFGDVGYLKQRYGVSERRLFSSAIEVLQLLRYLKLKDLDEQHFLSRAGQRRMELSMMLAHDFFHGKKRERVAVRGMLSILFLEGERLLSLINEAAERECFIASRELPKWKDSPPDVSTSKRTEEAIALVRCAFRDEGLVLPFVEDFKTALKLRNDRRIKDFRIAVSEFAALLAAGDVAAADRIRGDVRRANAAMRNAMRCRKVGELSTVLAVPGFVIDVLATGGFVGLGMALLGVGSLAYEGVQKRTHGWILIGEGK